MSALRLYDGEPVPNTGAVCPPEPLPVEAFGWVWREWVSLLRRYSAAKEAADALPEGSPARAAQAHVVGMLEHDLKQFRAETVSGLKLALGWLSQDDPASVYGAVATAAEDWRDRSQHERRIEELRGQVRHLEHEVAQARRMMAVIVAELGYTEAVQ